MLAFKKKPVNTELHPVAAWPLLILKLNRLQWAQSVPLLTVLWFAVYVRAAKWIIFCTECYYLYLGLSVRPKLIRAPKLMLVVWGSYCCLWVEKSEKLTVGHGDQHQTPESQCGAWSLGHASFLSYQNHNGEVENTLVLPPYSIYNWNWRRSGGGVCWICFVGFLGGHKTTLSLPFIEVRTVSVTTQHVLVFSWNN